MNSKPLTIPFGIVACTFSHNLSRNSCIPVYSYADTAIANFCLQSFSFKIYGWIYLFGVIEFFLRKKKGILYFTYLLLPQTLPGLDHLHCRPWAPDMTLVPSLPRHQDPQTTNLEKKKVNIYSLLQKKVVIKLIAERCILENWLCNFISSFSGLPALIVWTDFLHSSLI